MTTKITYQCMECGEETFIQVSKYDVEYADDLMEQRGWELVDRKNNLWLCPECCIDCEDK